MNTAKSYQPKQNQVRRNWHLFDANQMVVGRLAADIAKILQGKNKPTYSQHMDSGDYVVILNAEKAVFTGKKEQQKIYYGHSLWPGGLKKESVTKLRKEKPQKILEHAISGMLPKNRLHSPRMKRLKLVIGKENPYSSHFSKSNQQEKN